MCNGPLHVVAQFVACDDQFFAVADKALFHNCLVVMRPKSTTKDIPSTHNIMTYIHNQFVERLQELKSDILIS
ncbi:hypothetical protein L208DRAFT_1319775 [Tricholoma matsutake]|nr:hypothetical protein L208DRAFT_1319775 [Tricholoma matsutake 945]